MKCVPLSLTACALGLLFPFCSLKAQFLRQDFNTLSQTSEFASQQPTASQVHSLTTTKPQNEADKINWELAEVNGNQVLQLVENPDNRYQVGQWTKKHEGGKVLKMDFSLELQKISGEDKAAASLYFVQQDPGDNTSSSVAPAIAFRFAEVQLAYRGNSGLAVESIIRHETGPDDDEFISSPAFPGKQRITIVLNNDDSPFAYLSPDNSEEELASGKVDVWVGLNKVLDDVQPEARIAIGQEINRVKFISSSNGTAGTIRLDDINYTIPEPYSVPLPVVWLDFEGRVEGNDVVLAWKTASEINNSHFNIQRSADGIAYETIGQLEGQGNSSEEQAYTFSDKWRVGTLSGPLYYRLEQVDYDGTASNSKVIRLELPETDLAVEVAPNPCQQELSVKLGLQHEDKVRLLVRDGKGNTLLAEELQLLAGKHTLAYPSAGDWPAGVYLLEVMTNSRRHQRKLIKN